MMQIINKRKYFYALSLLLTGASLVVLVVWGLKFGIDFTGGTEMKVSFENNFPRLESVREKLGDLNLKGLSVADTEDQSLLVRYNASSDEINDQVFSKVKEVNDGAKQLQLDFIGASVSDQLKKNALWAIFLAVIGIAGYIGWAFKKVSRPVASWKYGLAAVIALSHDILITVGVFVVLGKYLGVEVGVPFIAALLTILGYSVNDTIVVFDRTRENLMRTSAKEDFENVVNRSLNETLARSINTSLTVIIVLIALVLLGGEAIKGFSLALLIGVTFGTYSSIYVASALLVTIYKFQLKSK